MSEFDRSEIIYEEGWRSRSPDPAPADTPPAPPADDGGSKPLLISIQLILCAVAALVLFLLKTMDSPAYHGFMTRYRAEMNRTLIGRSFFGADDGDAPATADEVTVRSSPDELLPR